MEPPPLNFSVFSEALHRLLIATGTKLSKERPWKYQNILGARELFVMHVRVGYFTYRSALYLAAETPADSGRLTEFCVSLPLLNRGILDSLFTVLFLLEDLPQRCAWFREADFREARLEYERYTEEYGSSPDPGWQKYLEGLALLCHMSLGFTNLTPEQASNPKALRHWPNPGAMVTHGVSPASPLSPGKAFMKYLDDFFYKDLSQQAKLGGVGPAKRAAFLIDEIKHMPDLDAEIKQYRRAQIGQAIALILALASEIEAYFNFGLREDVLSLWQMTAPSIVVVNEVYQKRYRALIGGPPPQP